jgi:iron complex outermembrane receptor protein
VRGLLLVVLLLGLAPAAARGQTLLPDLSIEDLMKLDAGRVYGASERLQPVTEAPASVSFITADEIARFGYRTLADILRAVRGLYVSDDRNFSLAGVRGFAKPGDYNSRILLLINGHRVNDNVFGQAEIGAEFGLDPATFERVEIIRGPASALYGDSAFFAVVNVITRKGESIDGATVAVDVGTLGTRMTRATVGDRLANGLDYAASATYEHSDGNERLYYPVFDTPETNNGVAERLDAEGVKQVYGRLSFGGLSVTGAYGTRTRIVPTASFGTLFNEQEHKEQTTDRHTLLDAEYTRSLQGTRVALRGSYDRFTFDGTFPFAPLEPGGPKRIAATSGLGSRWTAGARLSRSLAGRQVLTGGVELIENLHQDQKSGYVSPPEPVFDIRRSSTQYAVYLQDEVRPVRWLILNGGLRYDSYEDFDRITPRTAVIVLPSSDQSFKYLYGRAFRAPNAYELNDFYFGESVRQLRPESIDTHELVWERYLNDRIRTSVSAYWYRAEQLITLVADPDALIGTTFVNQDEVRAKGIEFEGQVRLLRGGFALASYGLRETIDSGTGATLPNSPTHTAKARISLPGPLSGSFISAEAHYLSSRATLIGTRVSPAFEINLSVVQPIGDQWELAGSIQNLFDYDYADPVSSAHLQDAIPQNGRTARIGLRWKLWRR